MFQTKTWNKIDWRVKIGLETCFDLLKITRGRSISFKCSTRRNNFDCPCIGSTIYPCKIKSPVTPREYHLSLGIRGLLLLVIRNEDMLSLPASDVTPSQTTGFILTTPSICHSKLVLDSAKWSLIWLATCLARPFRKTEEMYRLTGYQSILWFVF